MLDELTGRRVALRHRIAPDGSPGPRFSDAVGELTPEGPDAVLVHTRSGVVRISRDDVVAVREVPPAPARRPSWSAVAELDRIRSTAWPAPARTELGGWLLRAAGGYTRRANSALAVDDPGMPVERALDRVRTFAAEHGIDPVVQTPSDSPWSHRILDAGWRVLPGPGGECVVLVTSTGSPDSAPDWPATPPDAWWEAQPDPHPAPHSPAWHVLTPGKQSKAPEEPPPPPPTPGEQSKAADTTPPPPLTPGEQSKAPAHPLPDAVGFGMIGSAEGRPVAAIRAAVVHQHVYVARLHVRDSHRRHGLGARLTRQALAWGAAHGARYALLDVARQNTAARALYRREGWTEHHGYQYLVPA